MSDWLSAFGFSNSDWVMLCVSPPLGLIGSMVRVLMIRNSLETLPTYPTGTKPFSLWFVYSRFNWYLAWSVVGLGSGLLIALLFAGSLQPGSSSVARVLALALLAGYGAPALWKRQEETVSAIVEARLKQLTAIPKPQVPVPPPDKETSES